MCLFLFYIHTVVWISNILTRRSSFTNILFEISLNCYLNKIIFIIALIFNTVTRVTLGSVDLSLTTRLFNTDISVSFFLFSCCARQSLKVISFGVFTFRLPGEMFSEIIGYVLRVIIWNFIGIHWAISL